MGYTRDQLEPMVRSLRDVLAALGAERRAFEGARRTAQANSAGLTPEQRDVLLGRSAANALAHYERLLQVVGGLLTVASLVRRGAARVSDGSVTATSRVGAMTLGAVPVNFAADASLEARLFEAARLAAAVHAYFAHAAEVAAGRGVLAPQLGDAAAPAAARYTREQLEPLVRTLRDAVARTKALVDSSGSETKATNRTAFATMERAVDRWATGQRDEVVAGTRPYERWYKYAHDDLLPIIKSFGVDMTSFENRFSGAAEVLGTVAQAISDVAGAGWKGLSKVLYPSLGVVAAGGAVYLLANWALHRRPARTENPAGRRRKQRRRRAA